MVDLDLAEVLTRWSVRLAVAFYLVRVFIDLRFAGRHGTASQASRARWFWTLGFVFYVVHVACAFGFYHQWSHLAAYRHTAEQTAAVLGIDWGGGLYFNYAFTLFWLTDLVRWWRGGVEFPYRRRGYFWTLHAVFAFMMFNATVVFGPPWWRWTAPVIAAALVTAWLSRRR